MKRIEYTPSISHYNPNILKPPSLELRKNYSPIEIFHAYLTLINSNLATDRVDPTFIEEQEIGHLDSSVQRAHYLGRNLEELNSVLGLDPGYLSIATGNQYLQIKSGERAISVIQPTHVMRGVEFVIPHEDHMRDLSLDEMPKVQIGEWVRIAKNCRLDIGGGLIVGDRVWIGKNVHRYGHSHSIDVMGILRQSSLASSFDYKLTIQDDAMIGFNSEITNTVDYLGEGSIVGQESLITKWVGDFSVLVGNNRILSYLPAHAYYKYKYGNNRPLDELARVDWEGELLDEYQSYSGDFLTVDLRNSLVQRARGFIPPSEINCFSFGIDETTLSSIAGGFRTDSYSSDYQRITEALTVASEFKNSAYRNRRLRPVLHKLGIYNRYHITQSGLKVNPRILETLLKSGLLGSSNYVSAPTAECERCNDYIKHRTIANYQDSSGVSFSVIQVSAREH